MRGEGRGPALTAVDRLRVGEVQHGEKMLYSGTDPESYITEYTLVYEDIHNTRSRYTE